MSSNSDQDKDSLLLRAISNVNKITGTPSDAPILTASYKPPASEQVKQAERGEAWWRDQDWSGYAAQYLPGVGLGFLVYPYMAVWEKIWGAIPTEDYGKYKQLITQDPLIADTIQMHTINTVAQGYELDYPIDVVSNDVKQFLDRHSFLTLLKILVREHLIFGNAYMEIVRMWICPNGGHDLAALRPSHEDDGNNGKFWYTERMDIVAKHNEMYPDHVLENPYGEIVRFKPLDPSYMRVRRDAYGSLAPTERILFYNGNTLQMGTIGEYASKVINDETHKIEYINENTRLIKHPFSLPSLMGNSIGMAGSPHLLEHNYNGDMYVIETRGGRKIDVTGNHSIFLWQPNNPKQSVKKGKQILKEARDIQVGDYVVLSKSLPIPDHQFMPFSVYQLLSNEGLKLWKQNGMVCHKKSRMSEMVENTEELLYILGLYVAEGSYTATPHNYRIDWWGDKAMKIIPFLESIGIKYSYKIKKNNSYGKNEKFYSQIKECPMVSVSNRLLVETIKKLGLLEKTIPSWIFELPRYQLNYFLAGLWDGDGRHNGKIPDFEFYTKDRRLAEDVSLLLTRFGIFAYIYEKDVHKDGTLYYTVQAVVTPVNPIEWKNGVKQKLSMASVDDIVLAKVTKIKKYNYSGPVYDFDVPFSQSFLNANAVVAHNTTLGYAQWYIFPLVTFLADEVIQIRYTPSAWQYENAYGNSMLRPMLFHEEALREYEAIMQQIMRAFVKPFFLIELGTSQTNALPTMGGVGNEISQAQFNQFLMDWGRRKPGADVVVRTGGLVSKVKPITPQLEALQSTEFWLNWLNDQRQYALNAPKHLVDPKGLNRSCYSEDTKVLTENGWKLHNEVTKSERIMNYDPQTGTMFFDTPKALYSYNYKGEMYHFFTRGTDLLVTPEHKIVYKTYHDNKINVAQAKDIPKIDIKVPSSAFWEGKESEFVEVPFIELKQGWRGVELEQSIKISTDSFLSFAGYYISEGGMDSKNHYLFTLGQSKTNKKKTETIRNNIMSLPLHIHEYEDDKMTRWNIDGKQICLYMTEKFGEGCNNKKIASELKNLSKRQLRILFDAIMLGDGTIDKRPNRHNMTYYTTSPQLAKDVAEIAIKLGYSVKIIHNHDGNVKHSVAYRVLINENTERVITANKRIVEQYNGKIYCFSTTTGFYVTMRNGCISFQGNTANLLQESYFTFINSIRQALSEQLQGSLMPMILRSLYGTVADELIHQYGIPKFIWKPIKEESLADKTPVIIDLYRSNIIDINEARRALGYKPLEKEELETELEVKGLESTGPTLKPPRPAPTGGSDESATGGGETAQQQHGAETLETERTTQTLQSKGIESGESNMSEEVDEKWKSITKRDAITEVDLTELEDFIDDMRDRLSKKKLRKQAGLE